MKVERVMGQGGGWGWKESWGGEGGGKGKGLTWGKESWKNWQRKSSMKTFLCRRLENKNASLLKPWDENGFEVAPMPSHLFGDWWEKVGHCFPENYLAVNGQGFPQML